MAQNKIQKNDGGRKVTDPLKIVFMGTPDFALPTLETLATDGKFELLAVYTQPDRPKGRGNRLVSPPVKVMAREYGIEVHQPEKLRDEKEIEQLKSYAPDFIVVVAYGQILSREVLKIPRYAPINLHASLLPRLRGAAPINRAIMEGDKTSGITTMLMAQGLDTGDILLKSEVDLTEDETAGTLHDRLSTIGSKLMVETLIRFKARSILPIQQDEKLATYAKKIVPEDLVIDWSKPAQEVSAHIRGLSPYPGAVTKLDGRNIKIMMAQETHPESMPGKAGELVRSDKDGITVSCGHGFVKVTQLKPEGKKVMSAYSFMQGTPALKHIFD